VQDNSGDCLSLILNKLKGGIAMVKTVQLNSGFKTALVVLGWLSFVGSFFINEPISFFSLQAIARVLP
jgi:hypothetical protein